MRMIMLLAAGAVKRPCVRHCTPFLRREPAARMRRRLGAMELGPHLVLSYDYVPDVLERRAPHREAHLGHAGRARDDGFLVCGGAVGDPPHGGLLVFAGADRAAVERFAREDPYVIEGIVTAWRVEPWNVVV